jgi:hypothetical protein
MNVKKLIKELKKLDPNTLVAVETRKGNMRLVDEVLPLPVYYDGAFPGSCIDRLPPKEVQKAPRAMLSYGLGAVMLTMHHPKDTR